MRTLERIELLIRLAYKNANPFEGKAAWDKAFGMMSKHAVSKSRLSPSVLFMYNELSGDGNSTAYAYEEPGYGHECVWCRRRFYSGLYFDEYCSTKCRLAWLMHRQEHAKRRGIKRTHHVQQPHCARDVQDKDWQDQTCRRCGKLFNYMTYPGNPRLFCEDCRAFARREYDKERKRVARAKLKAAT